MPYQLSEINEKIRRDPAAFLAECDAHYQERIHAAVDKILARMKESPIVLLSGPSGSGKTTTAMKVERELERRGSTPTRCPWTTTSRPSTAGPPPARRRNESL